VGYILSILPLMLIGLRTTLEMYFCSCILVLPLGVLFGVLKVTGPKPLHWLLDIYTWAWRGTPLLLQLMIAVFGLPMIGINLPQFLVAATVFCLNTSAYVTEIMRAAISSVDVGQYEACQALGISHFRTMIRVIIPQSIRIAIPPTCSAMINLIKDTALVTVISLMDLTRSAVVIANRDFNIIPYVISFIVFILLTNILIRLFGYFEKRATAYD
jgi:polar amino acid transport system permease protein